METMMRKIIYVFFICSSSAFLFSSNADENATGREPNYIRLRKSLIGQYFSSNHRSSAPYEIFVLVVAIWITVCNVRVMHAISVSYLVPRRIPSV
ncbi:hypothetical protein Tcan_09282 [Toxocara canis]|uniref:Uncharacterized protein n=1 Tax=Toxocara canis TaxID=6265 RepID=A0A0B2VAW0_TOXCA|nr:hypothetical protein Tcan_09282 [Toxocara canis]